MTALISARSVTPPSTGTPRTTPLIGELPAGARIPHSIGGRLSAPALIGLRAPVRHADADVNSASDVEPGSSIDSGTSVESEDRGSSFARCSDGHATLAHLFFSEDDHDLARAKAICGPCGRSESCLSGAIERAEPYGVWGGKLVLDGVPVEFKAKRGRPRKHPLPVLVVDEVPIPRHLVA